MTDIVVVGRREQQPDGSYRLTYSTEAGVPGIRFVQPNVVSEHDESLSVLEIAVKIEKTKSETDQAKLEDAARELVKAAMEIITALENSNSAAVITVLRRTTTVGEMLDTLKNTEFTVTDATVFNNNGVGSAQRGVNGAPNLDKINYEAIIGSSTSNGYADEGFPQNSGMRALMLYEVAHMTGAGQAFFERSYFVAGHDQTVGGQFYGTDYATNLEAFANEIMSQTAIASNVNLYGVRPGTAAAPVSPEAIYQSHTGQPFTE